MNIKYPTHELDDEHLPNSVYDILRSSGGYFVGNIHLDPIELPHLALSKTLDHEGKSIREFEERVVQSAVGNYALHKDQPMLIISRMLAKPRLATYDEIMHDVDNFGEQVWWPKDHYAAHAGVAVEDIDYTNLQTFEFPKGSIFDGEEYIYMGPTRWSKFIFSTFIDQYPNRVSFEQIEEVIKGLDPDPGKLGEGGFIVAVSEKGLTAPLKYVQKNQFGHEREVIPTKFEQIKLDKLYTGLKNHINANIDEIEEGNKETLEEQRRVNPGLFNFSEDGSMSNWYNFFEKVNNFAFHFNLDYLKSIDAFVGMDKLLNSFDLDLFETKDYLNVFTPDIPLRGEMILGPSKFYSYDDEIHQEIQGKLNFQPGSVMTYRPNSFQNEDFGLHLKLIGCLSDSNVPFYMTALSNFGNSKLVFGENKPSKLRVGNVADLEKLLRVF